MPEKSHSLHSSTGYWVTRLARTLEADVEARLKKHKVTRASWAVLSAIRDHDVTTPAALASFIGIDRAVITRHLDRLEKQGLIHRDRSVTDRRAVNLKMTQKGTSLTSKLAAASVATNTKLTTGLTQSEIDGVLTSTKKMLSNFDVAPPDL